MKVLVVGGGGREHVLCAMLKKSPRVQTLFCAPGNGGIAQVAKCVDLKATDIDGVVDFARRGSIDFCVVAPDDPLYLGMVDALEANGIPAFGPSKAAAEIEGSKVFAKDLMKKYGLPTAQYAVFEDYKAACAYINEQDAPIVVKADGLALGKGVAVCQTRDQAFAALERMMVQKEFGDAGARVVIEEFISGPEVSVLAFCDGKTLLPMLSAQDHKRAFDGDQGPNTGGMGVFCPSDKYTQDIEMQVTNEILLPTVEAMAKEGRPFKGVLYFGLMLTQNGPKILEYNARFGDPETQAVLPLLENDLLDVLLAVREQRLHEITLTWKDAHSVCVVIASGGYPVSYEKGKPITGLDQAEAMENVLVFHAGTQRTEDGFVSAGGRVLGVTGIGETRKQAIGIAYGAVEKISFDGSFYRRDIGVK